MLVVDDEEIARNNLAHLMEKEGFLAAVASNGEDALRLMAARDFDVVLTDLRMGPVDGMAFIGKISARRSDTKIIVVTGYATVPSAVEAVKKGAFHYISKPFKLDEVRAAVRQAVDEKNRAGITKGSVLCFAGPPGTGKTSLGRSVAKALGRKFLRIALGGMKDEAEIRRHRRTYAGAKPGRIIEAIRRVESANPVIMLDELDKIGHDFKGDPSSALLEVLDPEQNKSFVDHYLNVPFDLSGVMFILTANVLENIPMPLIDRMEVIEFSGYSHEEKAAIAQRFLIPRHIREKGLKDPPPLFQQDAIDRLILEYTREAGMRDLDRRIATICRKIARDVVEERAGARPVVVTQDALEHYLGPGRYHSVIEDRDRIGVTTSLV